MAETYIFKNSVNADIVYVEGELVGRDVAITLPEVRYLTTSVNAMGPITLPLAGLVEAMEFSVNKVGIDIGLLKAITPEAKVIDCRWTQIAMDTEGKQAEENWKAVLKVIPQSLPSLGINPGESINGSISFTVLSYKLYNGSDELLNIDKLKNIIKINGKDYNAGLNTDAPATSGAAE